jgi:hypothetical protein
MSSRALHEGMPSSLVDRGTALQVSFGFMRPRSATVTQPYPYALYRLP